MDTQAHTLNAAREILRPLAKLLLAQGIQLPQLVELLKAVLVEAAQEQLPPGSATRAVSKISVSTGLHRKDVKRLLEEPAAPASKGRFLASEVFARWVSDPLYLDRAHKPKVLPRLADPGIPCFDSLARSITRDVHPRAILEEMKRLDLVSEDGDEVALKRDTFAIADRAETLRVLASNVGDHLAAATANVLTTPRPFLEQALVADELSEASQAELHALFLEQWRQVQRTLLPEMTRLWTRDREESRVAQRRVRLGMYDFADAMPPSVDEAPATPDPASSNPDSGKP